MNSYQHEQFINSKTNLYFLIIKQIQMTILGVITIIVGNVEWFRKVYINFVDWMYYNEMMLTKPQVKFACSWCLQQQMMRVRKAFIIHIGKGIKPQVFIWLNICVVFPKLNTYFYNGSEDEKLKW